MQGLWLGTVHTHQLYVCLQPSCERKATHCQKMFCPLRVTPGLLAAITVAVIGGYSTPAVGQTHEGWYCGGEFGDESNDDFYEAGHQVLWVNSSSQSACESGPVAELTAYLGDSTTGTLHCEVSGKQKHRNLGCVRVWAVCVCACVCPLVHACMCVCMFACACVRADISLASDD